MKTIVVAVLAAAVLIVGALAWPHPAEGATNPACMTRAEFGRIHQGQTQARVRAIVGSAGRVTLEDHGPDGYRFVSRDWRACGSRYGFAMVNFSTTERADGQPGVYDRGYYS